MPWSREKIGKTAQEIADHLMLVENVKARQLGQKEMANAIAALNSRIATLEIEIRALKAETKLEAIRETQQMMNAVQGAFHEKLSDLNVRVSQFAGPDGSKAPLIALSKTAARRDGELPPA